MSIQSSVEFTRQDVTTLITEIKAWQIPRGSENPNLTQLANCLEPKAEEETQAVLRRETKEICSHLIAIMNDFDQAVIGSNSRKGATYNNQVAGWTQMGEFVERGEWQGIGQAAFNQRNQQLINTSVFLSH